MWLTKDKRSGYYRAFWIDGTGRQRSLSTKQTTETAARAWTREMKLEEMESAGKLGALGPQLVSLMATGKNLSVDRAIDQFIEWGKSTANLSTTTLATMTFTLKAWSRDSNLGKSNVNAVTTTQVSEYINRPTNNKASTSRNALSILRRFFEYLRGEGLVSRNPAANCRLNLERFLHVQREEGHRQPFTEAEVEKILTNTTGFWRLACEIAANTGLRLGDIATIEWECFREGTGVTVWTDKTDARISLPLPARLSELLRELPRRDSRFLFPDESAIARDPKRRALLSVQFARILARLEITGEKSFHSWRHTYVSKLAKEGVPVQRIAEAVGHANVETTAIYTHA